MSGFSAVDLFPNHNCDDAIQIVTFMPFGTVVHDEKRFANLMTNGISGSVSTTLCASKTTHFWTKFSCVLPSWMPLQEVLPYINVSFIGGSVATRATRHGCLSTKLLHFSSLLPIDTVIMC